ncbi:hypothetical protein F4780DRAFT_106712 [Xylariomycetidae sp. FL0641]|nr:hypothetical protein F4780DRAFT_106712 [Xylariomycetidae sp. FL0641]
MQMGSALTRWTTGMASAGMQATNTLRTLAIVPTSAAACNCRNRFCPLPVCQADKEGCLYLAANIPALLCFAWMAEERPKDLGTVAFWPSFTVAVGVPPTCLLAYLRCGMPRAPNHN